MEYSMIDLNGQKHDAIPEEMKNRLVKKGWQLVSENGQKLEPTLVKEVAEFIGKSKEPEKKSVAENVEEGTIEIVEAEIIEAEPQPKKEVKKGGRPRK